MTTSALETYQSTRRLIDAREVARLLGCSWRTVYRHADMGRIPFGMKLGDRFDDGTPPNWKASSPADASRPRGRGLDA